MQRGLFAPLAYLCSCLDPTEVKVEVQTDICELRRVAIVLEGASSPVADQPVDFDRGKCLLTVAQQKPFTVGTIVFVPTKPNARFSFEVIGGVTNDCSTGQCVHAGRSVSYIQHQSLPLSVELERACLDRLCPMGTTCRAGMCQPIDPLDGGRPDDAGSTCPPSSAMIQMSGLMESHAWTFDGVPFADVHTGMQVTLVNGAGLSDNAPKGCGRSLAFGAGPQPLGTMLTSNGFGASFYVFLTDSTVSPATILHKSMGPNGAYVEVGITSHTVVVTRCIQTSCAATTAMTMIPGNQWVTVEVLATSTGQTQVLIGHMSSLLTTTGTATVSGTGTLDLATSGASGILIDDLRIFEVP